MGIDTFGESAPAKVLWPHFGFTVDNAVAKVRRLVGRADWFKLYKEQRT